jgi:hypothetical protein
MSVDSGVFWSVFKDRSAFFASKSSVTNKQTHLLMSENSDDTTFLQGQLREMAMELQAHERNNSEQGKVVDLIRIMCIIGTAVVMVIMIVLVFVPGGVDLPRKEVVVSVFSVISIAFITMLCVAKRQKVFLLLLMVAGVCSFCILVGYAMCMVQKLS